MERYICIHGHFYQPPRENPWLEEIELQDSAYPYHDWNQRVTAECYGPNSASRILDPDGRIVDILNNYSKISFDFGPTLISWIEKHKPEVHQAILEADRSSAERFSGHGSALAQAYNHVIMPLANRRDKNTQVVWGIKDFQKRFARLPEGMWLPETAADLETLEVLAEHGIKFTILSPRQAKRVRKIARGARWQEVSEGRIDPTAAYRCMLPSSRSINLFFYDGPISQDIAFGALLNDGEAFAKRLLSAFTDSRDWPQIVHVATDGETYGHHHRFGDMALAYCLNAIESQGLAKITNYGEYLEKHPPAHAVEIFENSSWSCVHGVERWRDSCGCNSGTHSRWTQAWRKPLRESMDALRDKLAILYETETSRYLKDPWGARNDYIGVLLDRSPETVERFLETHAARPLTNEEHVKALKLLEMQRNALLMYTSCGWFFDEVSGTETVQVMQFAARAIQLAEDLSGTPYEKEFVQTLEKAASNIEPFENGAKVYQMFVKPAMLDLLRVGAHFAVSSLFEEYPEKARIYCYTAHRDAYSKAEGGRLRLAVGKTRIQSDITREEEPISFAVLHLGDHNLNGGVKKLMAEEDFTVMHGEIKGAFDKGDVPEVIRLMDKYFGMNSYSLRHLFRDEQRKVLDQILRPTLDGIEASFRDVYEKNYPLMSFLQSIQMPLPIALSVAGEYIVNLDLIKAFGEERLSTERLQGLINEVKKWSFKVDHGGTLGFIATSWLNSLMQEAAQQPDERSIFEKMISVLNLLGTLPVEFDLWKAQNEYFAIKKTRWGVMQGRAEKGDGLAKRWMEVFHELGSRLYVKVSG